MPAGAPELPPGYALAILDAIDSTNAEAGRRAAAGERGPLWLWARAQTRGRGRQGRTWISDPGNLYASLLLTVAGGPARAAQVSFVAALAMADTVQAALPGGRGPPVALKWPNDVLLAGSKVAGILIETAGREQEGRLPLAVGCGLNLAHAPAATRYPASCLLAHGAALTPAEAMRLLAAAFARWQDVWQNEGGFAAIRAAWLERAAGRGERLDVHVEEGSLSGIFVDLDHDGALVLRLYGGGERRIFAGDVFFR